MPRGFANNPTLAKQAGARGGKAPQKEPRGFARLDKDKMREISVKGGQKSRRPRKEE